MEKLKEDDVGKGISLELRTEAGKKEKIFGKVVSVQDDGVEVEVLHQGRWLEILEAGLAHPNVLENAGLDPSEYSGLASGLGLDRLAMLVKGINDIRILRSKDPRIVQQMRTTDLYKEVSRMPSMRRDISVVVDGSLFYFAFGDCSAVENKSI